MLGNVCKKLSPGSSAMFLSFYDDWSERDSMNTESLASLQRRQQKSRNVHVESFSFESDVPIFSEQRNLLIQTWKEINKSANIKLFFGFSWLFECAQIEATSQSTRCLLGERCLSVYSFYKFSACRSCCVMKKYWYFLLLRKELNKRR